LVFGDPSRIEPLLAGRRVQLVFAGKAHPDDAEGRRIVANLVAMTRRYPASVVFVPDYDMGVARLLTRGADVWLNNPIRPLEACGTSGMKAALNGGLNLSVLDGWWPEGCRHGINGWAIGDGGTGCGRGSGRRRRGSRRTGWCAPTARASTRGISSRSPVGSRALPRRRARSTAPAPTCPAGAGGRPLRPRRLAAPAGASPP